MLRQDVPPTVAWRVIDDAVSLMVESGFTEHQATRAYAGLASFVLARCEQGDAAAERELLERFTGALEFGTAGLRGILPLERQAGVDLAIITLGADGIYYATSEESGRVPAFPVEVVDAIGAGDALTAAVAYGLMEGVSPGEAVRLGMAAAAQTVSYPDTVCPHLTLESLYELLVM